MKGSETRLIEYLEGASKRFVIPVYQRKYDWKEENCQQLFEDLKKTVIDKRNHHFFGSIVSSVVGNGATTEYHIIDGQQRLTTVSLLLLAIRNLIKQKKITAEQPHLDDQINDRFLVSPWAQEDDKIKLHPVKSDREALRRLYGQEEDYIPTSKLTLNYRYFCNRVMKKEISVDDLFAAIGKLEVISITLDHDDDAQLIFESLNSTGMALSEGDKIRNYVLMGQPPQKQAKLFEDYWAIIEKCTRNNVSEFVRDYLSIRQQITPTIGNVYRDFKNFAEKEQQPVEKLLEDLRRYARLYEKLLTCKSDLKLKELDDCLYRMARLEIVVTRPFLLEVLRLNLDGKISNEDVLAVFRIVEIYLFRRNICEVPTNALNKIFLNLNREVLRYDNTTNNYVEKVIYALLSKKDSGRFPDDEEFSDALANKQVYLMRGKYKAYLFERLENYGTIEAKDVYTQLDNNVYTIEHIMPQHLTSSWVESLGANAEEIHTTWLHRLANLTLTGYNPNLSNKTFVEKRDAEEGGYRASGLRMTQKISMKEEWGLKELEERSTEMVAYSLKIWSYPQTSFVPAEKEFDSCTLDDENVDLTGRDLIKYGYQNVEHPVNSWVEMMEQMISYMHKKDTSVLSNLAYGADARMDLSSYVSNEESVLRSPMKVAEDIYFERNTSTATKISILRRLFTLYDMDPMDLVFYLKDPEADKAAEIGRFALRKKYWEYALPIIQAQHAHRGTFTNCGPTGSNSSFGYFGISGFHIDCTANYDNAYVCFYMGKNDAASNKAAFNTLFSHKDDIEKELGVELGWNLANHCKASWIDYYLTDVSITNEADWPQMAKFQAEWSDKLCNVLLPYLQNIDATGERLQTIAAFLREWVSARDGINANIAKSNRSYTRFTTDAMSAILPDIPDSPSGWNTDNHYFYEILNRTGNTVYIQFAISSRNITEEFRETCDKINEFYPAKYDKSEWQWRIPFRTTSVTLGEEISKEELFTQLDEKMQEVRVFETDLKSKLER